MSLDVEALLKLAILQLGRPATPVVETADMANTVRVHQRGTKTTRLLVSNSFKSTPVPDGALRCRDLDSEIVRWVPASTLMNSYSYDDTETMLAAAAGEREIERRHQIAVALGGGPIGDAAKSFFGL